MRGRVERENSYAEKTMNSLDWLKGCRFQQLHRRENDWVLSFEGNAHLVITCLWRLLEQGKIRRTSEDDGQQFGLPAPVDAADDVNRLLFGAKVDSVRLNDGTVVVRINMCILVYLGSDSPLPTTERWNSSRPFSVRDVTADCPRAVREYLERPFIFLLQSIAGCGCGFGIESSADRAATYENVPLDVAELYRETDRVHCQGIAELHDWIRHAVSGARLPLRFLVTYTGAEETAPKRHETVTPAYFEPSDEEFGLEEFTLFDIVADER